MVITYKTIWMPEISEVLCLSKEEVIMKIHMLLACIVSYIAPSTCQLFRLYVVAGMCHCLKKSSCLFQNLQLTDKATHRKFKLYALDKELF